MINTAAGIRHINVPIPPSSPNAKSLRSSSDNRHSPGSSELRNSIRDMHQGKWDWLNDAGCVLSVLVGAATLLSPAIIKRGDSIARSVASTVRRLRFVQDEKKLQNRLANNLAHVDAFQAWMKRLGLFTALLMNINAYQIAVNTRQPSLAFNALFADVLMLVGAAFPSNFVFLMMPVAGLLYHAGKRNDIENYNHPDKRREQDVSWLSRPLANGSRRTGKRVKSFFVYIAEDFRRCLSLQPWREMKRRLGHTQQWAIPQSYQSALGFQTCLAGIVAGFLHARYKKSGLANAARIFSVLTYFIARFPLAVRAWQNRRELDGKAYLTAMPITLASLFFFPPFVSRRFFFLSGLSNFSTPLVSKSLLLNSRKYRALVEDLNNLYQWGRANPSLGAADILKQWQSDPAYFRRLRHDMGEVRLNFLLQTLKEADAAKRNANVRFVDFMKPRIQSVQ